MSLRILIAGGGTGGHVIPALAIGRELRDRHGADVRFVGTARGLETKLVPEAGFPLDLIRVGQLKNVSLMTRLRTVVDLPLGIAHCIRLLRNFRPQVVAGVGGYASGPAMMAAILLRIPTLAFEPNAIPGLANRLVGKHVSAAAVNFAETAKYFRSARMTGIPVRADFFALDPLMPNLAAAPRLLVFGGSQGARVFNEVLPKIVRYLDTHVPGLTIVHQSGANHQAATEAAYLASGADASRWQVFAYLDDMPSRFEQAQVILCRSGASTVAELAASGRAAVLVPFPGAADDHQLKNAQEFAKGGAAVVVPQVSDESLAQELQSVLVKLLSDGERCASMGLKARKLANAEAVSDIARMCVELAKN